MEITLAPFVPSDSRVIDEMLGMAKILPGEKIYDFGAGDGRVVVKAALSPYFARAVGLEQNEKLVLAARGVIKSFNLQKRAEVVHGSIFDYNYRDADVIFTYLNRKAMQELEHKLEAELKERARVVSHDFEVEGWMPSIVLEGIAPIADSSHLKSTRIFLYEMKKAF